MKSGWSKTGYQSLGFLIVIILAVYGRVITHGFLNYDDDRYILDNPFVNSGISREGIKWAFFSRYEANWHPLTWLSHMLDVSLFGLNAGWHHATNLFLHLANTLLLLHLLYRMARSYWPSFMVAALFALHPLHVESVAWIAERKDLLSTFLFLLTLLAYYRYTVMPGYSRYLLTLLCYCAGLMAKPMLVTLPLLLLVLDYWPLARPARAATIFKRWPAALLIEKAPFAALALLSSIITYRAQQMWGATVAIGQQGFLSNTVDAVTNYVRYLYEMFFPFNLAVFYPYNSQTVWWKPLLGATIMVAATVIAAAHIRRRPYLLAGWFWYIITLLPVSGIINIGFHDHADRYTYIPLTGIFIALAWFTADKAEEHGRTVEWIRGGGVCIVILALISALQLRYWKNSIDLFNHAVEVTTDNWLAHQHISQAMLINCRIPEALDHIRKAIRIKPDNATNYALLGRIYTNMRHTDDAIAALERSLQLKPDNVSAVQDLGVLYADAGRTGDAAGILEYLGKISPGHAVALEHYIHTSSGSSAEKRPARP